MKLPIVTLIVALAMAMPANGNNKKGLDCKNELDERLGKFRAFFQGCRAKNFLEAARCAASELRNTTLASLAVPASKRLKKCSPWAGGYCKVPRKADKLNECRQYCDAC